MHKYLRIIIYQYISKINMISIILLFQKTIYHLYYSFIALKIQENKNYQNNLLVTLLNISFSGYIL